MNILILEDKGSDTFYTERLLTKEGYLVQIAHSISKANSYLENESVDCLIVDLNMSPIGLDDGDVEATMGGLLTGWIWLRNYVYRRNEKLMKSTIIFSNYVLDFKRTVDPEIRKKLFLVQKGEPYSKENLLNFVRIIANRKRSSK